MSIANQKKIINEPKIQSVLEQNQSADAVKVHEILAKARELKGLAASDVATLTYVAEPELLAEIFQTARFVKEKIYGKRLVIFAPLYLSNFCTNECLYCAFRVQNKDLKRRALTQKEISSEARALIDKGQKRLLLVAGEVYTPKEFRYILTAIQNIYAVKSEHIPKAFQVAARRARSRAAECTSQYMSSETSAQQSRSLKGEGYSGAIRRLNVNIAPLSIADFMRLKEAEIGTYQLFQETYHQPTYQKVHVKGRKADYNWRLTAMDRAMQAGIDDVGIGVLFGLYNWRFEILALLQHVAHLNQQFGIGPHTISVPRLEPAHGSLLASASPWRVSDMDFQKIIAILRLAVPYTGIILSTRESIETRRAAFALGISQISAGSRTNPGGYRQEGNYFGASQFSLGDHRALDEVIRDIVSLSYIPSFCTACYRKDRTGEAFMALAKKGAIHNYCNPNAIATFQEYLLHYATPETRELGQQLIAEATAKMSEPQQVITAKLISHLLSGEGDVFL